MHWVFIKRIVDFSCLSISFFQLTSTINIRFWHNKHGLQNVHCNNTYTFIQQNRCPRTNVSMGIATSRMKIIIRSARIIKPSDDSNRPGEATVVVVGARRATVVLYSPVYNWVVEPCQKIKWAKFILFTKFKSPAPYMNLYLYKCLHEWALIYFKIRKTEFRQSVYL